MIIVVIPAFVNKNIPFRRALALQPFSRNCYPVPDLVLRKPIFLYVFFSRGVLFSQTPVCMFRVSMLLFMILRSNSGFSNVTLKS